MRGGVDDLPGAAKAWYECPEFDNGDPILDAEILSAEIDFWGTEPDVLWGSGSSFSEDSDEETDYCEDEDGVTADELSDGGDNTYEVAELSSIAEETEEDVTAKTSDDSVSISSDISTNGSAHSSNDESGGSAADRLWNRGFPPKPLDDSADADSTRSPLFSILCFSDEDDDDANISSPEEIPHRIFTPFGSEGRRIVPLEVGERITERDVDESQVGYSIQNCENEKKEKGGKSENEERDNGDRPSSSKAGGSSAPKDGSDESSSSSDGDSSDDSDDDDSDSDSSDEEEEEGESLAGAYKEKPKAPAALKISDGPVDLQFRPESSDIAIGTMNGDILLYGYTLDSTELKKTYEIHEKPVRKLAFNDAGTLIFSVSKQEDLAVIDVQTGAIKHLIEDIHKDGAHALQPIDDYLCATGDGDGVVKLFDFRSGKCVMENKGHTESITSLVINTEKKTLIASSADTTISAYNVRAKRFDVQSEEAKEEMKALAYVRSDTKLAVADNTGVLYLYDADKFGYHSATFGKPSSHSVSCMAAVSDKSVVVGFDNGVLRATHLFPNRVLGVVGQHDHSVDAVDVSPDGDFLASCDDEVVRFWNISYLKSLKVSDKEKADNKTALSKNLPSSRYQDAANFFADMDD